MNKATRTINKTSLAKKLFLVLVAQFLLLAPLFVSFSVYAQTEVPQDNSGTRQDPGADLSGGARSTDDTVRYHVDAIPQINTVLESAQNSTQQVIFEVEQNLAGEIVARNDVWQGLHKWWEEDIVSNLFHNIGELIGKWISELINGWIADTVQFLTGFLRVFVLNPNIAINGLGGTPGDDISPWVRQGADVMYGIAVDLLLLLFVLCIWKYWAEATWRGGGNLMGAVGRLIFTAGLMIAWPTIYAFEIQITNEMIQTVFFNSSDQVAALDAAMAAAVKAGLVATTALLTNATAGVAGQAFGGVLGAGPGGLVLGTVGGVIAWVGLIIYLVLGGILIAELIYILVLKAIQTALLTAQYMFAPIFLVFFATPDTENVTAGFVRSFVEVSLWTFVWVGLLKVMTIIILSDYNPWGKILLAVGVLQLMIQVPSFLARAQISPMSDFISAGMITGGLLGAGKALGNTLQSRGTQLAEAIGGKFTTGAARGPKQSTSADLNGLPSGVANQKLYNDIKKAGDGKLGPGTKPPKKGGDGDGGPKLDANGKPINPAGGKTGETPGKKKDDKTAANAQGKKLNPIENEKKKTEGKKGSVSDALRGLNTAAKGTALTSAAAAAVAGMGAAGAFKKDADGTIRHASTGAALTADELKANASELATQGLVPPTTGANVETDNDSDSSVHADKEVSAKVLETGDSAKGKDGVKPPAKKDDDKTSAAAKAGMAAAAGALGAKANQDGKGKGDSTKAENQKGQERQLNVPVDEKTKVKGNGKDEAGATVVPPNQNAVDALTSGKDDKATDGLPTSEDVNGERLQVERDLEDGDSATAGTLKTNLTPGNKDGAGASKKVSGKLMNAAAAALTTGIAAKALSTGGKGDKLDATPAKPGEVAGKGGNFSHSDQASNDLKSATGAGVVEGKNLDAGAVGADPKADAKTVDLAQEAEIDQKQIAVAAAGVSPLIVAAMRNRGGAKGSGVQKDVKGQIIQGTGSDSTGGSGQTGPNLSADAKATASATAKGGNVTPDMNQGKIESPTGGKAIETSDSTTINNNDTKITQETDIDTNVSGKIVPPTIASAVAATGLGLAARNMARGGQGGKVTADTKQVGSGNPVTPPTSDVSAATQSVKGQVLSGAGTGADAKAGQGVITIDPATGKVVENANAENIQAQATVEGAQADGKGGINFNPAVAIVPPARAGATPLTTKDVNASIAPKLDGSGTSGIPTMGDAKITASTGAGANATANATANANLDASSLNADGSRVDQANVTGELVNASGQPVGAGTMDVKQQVGITPGAGAGQTTATQNVQAELNPGATNAGQLNDVKMDARGNQGQAINTANLDPNQIGNLDSQNPFDPNVQVTAEAAQAASNATETVNARIIPPQAQGANQGATVDVTGQAGTPPGGANVLPGGIGAGGAGGGGRGGSGGPGGPGMPDGGDSFSSGDDATKSPYLNRYHSVNENNPFESYQQAGYRMIPPRSVAGNIRLAQNTTLGPTTRADGKAELIGNAKGITGHVRTGEGYSDQQVAMQMMSAGYAGLIGNDPAAYDAARAAGISAGLDKPKGMAERMASGIMSYNGGSWSQTANAKQRFQLGMYNQAVAGSNAYVAGQSGNEYTQYLNDRYGPMTSEQQAMSAYVMTNSASPESAWNWAHIPATEALVRNSIPISGTSRAVASNLSVQKSPPWLVGAAVRGSMAYMESRAARELPADVDPMVKDAWVGREAQLMSPAVANTNAALALELDEDYAGNVDVVNQVAAQVGAGAKNSDYVAAYKSIANLQSTARSYSAPRGGSGGTIRTSAGGGGGNPQVDTQILGGGQGGGGYVNTQSYDVEVVPDYNIGAGGQPNITPGMLNQANMPGSNTRMQTNVNVNQAGGGGGASAPPLRHMRFESPVSSGSGSSSNEDVRIGNYRGGSTSGHTVEQHVEAEIIGSGGGSFNGIDENAINGNVQKWVAQYGSPESAASAVFVSMSEAGFRNEDMTHPQVAQVAMQVQANDPSMMEAAAIAVDRLGPDKAGYEQVVEVQAILDADSRNTPQSIDKSTIQTAGAIRGMSQQIRMENPQFENISMPPTQRIMTQLSEHDDFVPRENVQPGQYRRSVLDFMKEKFQRKYDEANGIRPDNDRSSRFA